MAEMPPGSPRRLARSSSGVWWKLGDASPEVEQRLRGIAEEEAAVRARMERRHAAARKVVLTSGSFEVVALLYGLWRARNIAIGWRRKLLLLPALAIPAILLAAFGRFRKILDARDEQKLQRLAAERKANIGSFRGSYHNLQKLIEQYDPDAAAAAAADNKEVSAAAAAADNKEVSAAAAADNKEVSAAAAAADNKEVSAASSKKLKRTQSRLSFHVGDE